MKKLTTIILAIIMTLLSTPQKATDEPHVTVVKTPQTAITVQAEQVPEDNETTAETAFVGEASETGTEVNTEETTATESQVVTEETDIFTEEKTPTEQETVTDHVPKSPKIRLRQNRKKKPWNASTRETKALLNTNFRSAVS